MQETCREQAEMAAGISLQSSADQFSYTCTKQKHREELTIFLNMLGHGGGASGNEWVPRSMGIFRACPLAVGNNSEAWEKAVQISALQWFFSVTSVTLASRHLLPWGKPCIGPCSPRWCERLWILQTACLTGSFLLHVTFRRKTCRPLAGRLLKQDKVGASL